MGNGFFMQNTSQQSYFPYHCLTAYFSVIYPWTVREGYFSVMFYLIFSELYFRVLLFELFNPYSFRVVVIWAIQSSLIICYFYSLVIKPFLVLRFLTPYSTQLLPAPTVWTSPLILQDYVFCSKISWYKLLLDVIVVRL